jgi:hypothetical protein
MRSRKLFIVMMLALGLACGCSSFNTNLTTQTSSSVVAFLSPAHVTAGSGDQLLTVNGAGFVTGAIILWNGTQLTTTLVSAQQVTATVPAADFASAGTAQVAVQIPGSAVSGASSSSATTTTEVSNVAIFTIDASAVPVPTIVSISPSSINIGSAAFTMTVTGTNFVSSTDPTKASVIYWNGSTIAGTAITGTTTAKVTIPASLVASIAPVNVAVFTPVPVTSPPTSGGGTSNAKPFTICTSACPAPAAKLAPSMAKADLQISSAATSADRRFVVYAMASTDGVTEQPGTTQNVFVRDGCDGVPSGCSPSTSLVSVGIDGHTGDGDSTSAAISADGRYVAFVSAASNLVDGDDNEVSDVFVRDTCAGAPTGCTPSTQLISVAADGTQANFASGSASISSTGRYITFTSQATNLDPAASSGSSSFSGAFVRDTCIGAPAGCTPSTQRINLQN